MSSHAHTPAARTQLATCRGIPVLIDAAHALGMLPVNLQQLQPDFYVSNCHKWLCGARGSALLYVAPHWQQHLQPPVLSHGSEAGFLSRFIWVGCRDYAPLLAISSAVRWWRSLGATPHNTASTAAAGASAGFAVTVAGVNGAAGAAAAAAATVPAACCDLSIPAHPGDGGTAARSYMYALLREAADMLAANWGSECLGPASMSAAMTLVKLPEGGVLPAAGSATSADAKYVQVRVCVYDGVDSSVASIVTHVSWRVKEGDNKAFRLSTVGVLLQATRQNMRAAKTLPRLGPVQERWLPFLTVRAGHAAQPLQG